MRPGLLAIRAINQYRRRDVLAYLGLRYYLESSCARSDIWTQEIATHLVTTRATPVYFRSFHFKEMAENGSVVYRDLYLPGPNEILVEAALLNECSAHSAFNPTHCVYSYHFPERDNKEGIFRSYFPGYRNRHISIASYCKDLSNAQVLYTDIKKFYPTISKELASKAWKAACDSSAIPVEFRELGEHLLSDHSAATPSDTGLGVLTGPMFSHLIANLVLAELDQVMVGKMEGGYWRYVDDFVLVGDLERVRSGRELLKSLLSDMGFSLHDEGKDFVVDSTVWFEGRHDFDDAKSKAWMRLVANIKRFLVVRPQDRMDLVRAFSEIGINIPLLDYSNVVAESTYLEKLSDWLARFRWSARSIRALTVGELVEEAIQAQAIYQDGMTALLDRPSDVKGYERKRLIPKLRFYAGRLTYLALPEVLSSISSGLSSYPELHVQSSIMNAIHSRNVSYLLKLGTTAVQAAAQILRMQSVAVKCSGNSFDEVERQGLAILRLNGVEIDFADKASEESSIDSLNQFALGIDAIKLMRSHDPFIRELASLRGLDETLRHKSMLDTAFDRDEQLVFDIINQLRDSSYF